MALSGKNPPSSIIDNFFLFHACEQGDLIRIENHLNSLSSSEICAIRDENKASLVHYASRYGHLNILKYFLELKHIDISQLRTEHGATCAHDAAVCDQVHIINYIFHHNKINDTEKLRWTVRDEQGNTPLHLGKLFSIIFFRKINFGFFSGCI
jgi:ankyrin repeat protein